MHAEWLRDKTVSALGLTKGDIGPKSRNNEFKSPAQTEVKNEKKLKGIRRVEGLNLEEYAALGDSNYGSKVSLLSGLGNGGSPTKDKKGTAKIGNDHGIAFGRKSTTKQVLDQRKQIRRLLGESFDDKYATYEEH